VYQYRPKLYLNEQLFLRDTTSCYRNKFNTKVRRYWCSHFLFITSINTRFFFKAGFNRAHRGPSSTTDARWKHVIDTRSMRYINQSAFRRRGTQKSDVLSATRPPIENAGKVIRLMASPELQTETTRCFRIHRIIGTSPRGIPIQSSVACLHLAFTPIPERW